MYYAEMNTVSDKLSGIVLGETIIDTMRGMMQWVIACKVDTKDLEESEIKDKASDLTVLKIKFLRKNAVEFYY